MSDDNEQWTPIQAISWLLLKAGKAKFGKDKYGLLLGVVRTLVRERAALTRKVEQLEDKIATMQIPKPPDQYGVGGQGTWGDES